LDTERLMLQSHRNTTKHPNTMIGTWDHIVTSLSMRIHRSQTAAGDSTQFSSTHTSA